LFFPEAATFVLDWMCGGVKDFSKKAKLNYAPLKTVLMEVFTLSSKLQASIFGA